MTDLQWLCAWFEQNCDGEWEHEFGLILETIDNPGWSLRIDLSRSSLSDAAFAAEAIEDGDYWIRSWKDDGAMVFHAAGSPRALPEMISQFRRWAQTA